MRRARALRQLMACLRGDPPADCRWEDVLALANQSLVTPQLTAALEGHRNLLPIDVAEFLEDVRQRNRERNRRLWRALDDAVAALTAVNIVPTLLKGAARRATWPEDQPFDRMLSDIDLLVEPAEVDAALTALSSAGFGLAARYQGAEVHVVAELGRPGDPGYIDLHQRPPGPPGLSETPELAMRRREISLNGRSILVPDAASQIFYLLLHDQFHDGGFWRGGFDLRHLIDLRALASEVSATDRRWLRNACGTPLVRMAFDAVLVSMQRLAGDIKLGDDEARDGLWTHRRWLLQFSFPILRVPLAALAALLSLPKLLDHRAAVTLERRRVFGRATSSGTSVSVRLERFRRILSVRSGKI
ncbi:nucleotidyltransferase family protein [Sphingomonas sp. SRS2]|uniref:nucleotidyltransferase family protein n=1 Tax=Sphingomonas sp. SRS2 TaxID=133190 RepID=UPI0009FF3824|nr:nucleotidyltransferase family protein [Sphingomonas sp. SRS2]